MAIGGNTTAILQISTTSKNKIGEKVKAWHTVWEQKGFLDLQAGDSKYTTANAKMQESTHIFLCDYKPIPDTFEVDGTNYKVNAESARLVANSQEYDVMLIDDPMGLHKQIEIYLKYTGGQ